MTPDELDRYIEAMALAAGVSVPDLHREGVRTFVALAMAVARPLVEAELDERVESASIFRPEPAADRDHEPV